MKKLLFIICLIVTSSVYSQNNNIFFDGKTFELKHYVVNGEKEELDLIHPYDTSGNTLLPRPSLDFTVNENKLENFISGLCNATSAKYIVYNLNSINKKRVDLI